MKEKAFDFHDYIFSIMKQRIKNISTLFIAILIIIITDGQTSLQQYQPVKFSHVQINDQFWKPRIDKVATVTIPVCIDQTEVKTPRIRNFEIAAHLKKENSLAFFMMIQMCIKRLKQSVIH